MTDNAPLSRENGPGQFGAMPGAAAVGGAAARQMEPGSLGPAFPRTHHVL